MKDSTITTMDTSNLDYSSANEDMEDVSASIIESIVEQLELGNEAAAREMIMGNIEHINTPDSFTGRTLLHEAARYGHVDIVELLLSHSPELLYTPDPTGAYPIHSATAGGNEEVVKFMMSIDPLIITLENSIQNTPLHFSASFRNVNLIPLLLDAGESEPEPIVSSDGNTYYDDNVMLVIYAAELPNKFGVYYYDYFDNVQGIDLVSFFSV